MRACLCLSPPGNGSNLPSAVDSRDISMAFLGRIPHARQHAAMLAQRSLAHSSAAGRIGIRRLVNLPIKRRAADLQPTRHFRHLTSIMRDREANDFALQYVE